MAFDISKFAQSVNVSESDTRMQEIPLSKIYENQQNFYPSLDEEDALTLRDSIEANGLLEPLTVIADQDGKYRLISGHNRYRALTALRDSQGERWEQVSCLVLPHMTKQQELSAIIESNRQRKKDSWLLAQEAERLTESYVARKEAGEDLPGRIRERVAEALQVSQTKLATVKAIKENLRVPGFKRAWKEDKLSESVAYEISKLEAEAQYRLLDFQIDSGETLSIRTVKQFGRAWLGCRHQCEHTGRFCENAMRMIRGLSQPDGWHCTSCCAGCLSTGTCPYVCKYCKPPEAEKPNEPSAPVVPEWKRRGDDFGARLRTLRENTGLSRAEFAEKIDEYKGTYSAWENGNLPGCDRMPKLAKALGVSTDYLFCISDDPAPHGAPAAALSDGVHWQPLADGTWPNAGAVVVLRGESVLGGFSYQAARCQGGPKDSLPFEDASCGFDLDEEELREFSEWALIVDGCKQTE